MTGISGYNTAGVGYEQDGCKVAKGLSYVS